MKVQPLRAQLREATWRAILDAAEGASAESGTAGVSLQAIAERAGIAVGTIYNYFHDKEELLDALFTRRREELYGEIDRATKTQAGEPFAKQLEAFVSAVFSHFDTRRAFLRLALDSEKVRPAMVRGKDGRKVPAMQQLQNRAERIVAVGVKEKKLRDQDVALLATVLVSVLKGILVMRADGEASFAAETESVISLFLHGAAK